MLIPKYYIFLFRRSIIGKDVEIIVLIDSYERKVPKKLRKPGSAKGLITISDDFEAALDDAIVEEFYS